MHDGITFLRTKSKSLWGALVLLSLAAAVLILTSSLAQAQEEVGEAALGSPLHPQFPLLDEQGENVLVSGEPVSTMKTCGACHDSEYIAAHSDHAGLGLDELPGPGELPAAKTDDAVEMNCFLCHLPQPDNAARTQELEAGNYRWASTATLLRSGIVSGGEGRYTYFAEAFDEKGELRAELIQVQDPSSENCGQCHGTVHTSLDEPLVAAGYASEAWRAATTGQVIAPGKLADSGMNLADKESLSRTWDIHAERLVSCTDCHYSLNNPVYFQEDAATRPEHLSFDPRRLEFGEYLKQPDHRFARGSSAAAAGNPQVENSMRRCDGCHSFQSTHTWLPYMERHADALSCEGCHIPQIYSTAFQEVDWTSLRPDASPRLVYRGVAGDPSSLGTLVSGYQPVMMPRQNVGGKTKAAPFNLVTTWYWVAGEPAQPVSNEDLQAAWLGESGYPPQILSALDANGDGSLDEKELVLDSDSKVKLLAGRLEDLGLENPRIVGEVRPYSLNHNVTGGEWAVKDCTACHSSGSRLAEPMLLAGAAPSDAVPAFASDSGADAAGEIYRDENGALYYQPAVEAAGLYVLGHNRVGWIDLFGSLIFAATLLGVAGHGSLRFLAALRMPRHTSELRRVYMYGVYERLWHWLQTFTVLGLLLTGLIIHKPDTFGIFAFRGTVLVHNILAGILLANAGLSLFYHLASGEIRQYIPRPAGFFDQAISQAVFYLRGIFKGEAHPFEKTREKKLNPLQQATYFGLLNILLPLQVVTGIFMWGAQRWPELTAQLGGLPFLAPFHTLIAWLFAAFIVGHVYLTTTGHAPLASIQAMMVGWDEVEAEVEADAALPEAGAPAAAGVRNGTVYSTDTDSPDEAQTLPTAQRPSEEAA